MMSADAFLGFWPAWLALLVSGLFFFNRLIEESRKFASFFGQWGENRHKRAVKRHQIDLHAAQFADAIQEAVADARRTWEAEENEAITALDRRIGALAGVSEQQAGELRKVREQQEINAEYAEYEAAWHRFVRALTAQHSDRGDCVPIDQVPPHMTWWAFEVLHAKHGGGRDWWGITGA